MTRFQAETNHSLKAQHLSLYSMLLRPSAFIRLWYIIGLFQDDRVYFIDEGPLLPSLEHLVEYYTLRSDGLPCRLTYALSESKIYRAL